jgi:hypothetical protein
VFEWGVRIGPRSRHLETSRLEMKETSRRSPRSPVPVPIWKIAPSVTEFMSLSVEVKRLPDGLELYLRE